jgi:hypothetical protein
MDLETLEALALANDPNERARALASLVPGTEEHDYHEALLLQHAGELDRVDGLLEAWRRRHGDGGERQARLERRQLLLRAKRDFAAHAERLREQTGAVTWHEPEAARADERHPTRLDPALVTEEALLERALGSASDLSYVTDDGLAALSSPALSRLGGKALSPSQRRHLLSRLARSGLPGLVELVAKDLADKTSSGFGSLAAHRALTLGELTRLATLRPELVREAAWVEAVLRRLAPPDDVDLELDLDAREQALAAQEAFVMTLPALWNGLKAVVLHHRLALERRRGRLSRERFMAYLALPRVGALARPELAHGGPHGELVREGASFPATGLPALPDEEPLVRAILADLFASEDGQAFAELLPQRLVDEVLAETRLLAGDTSERWVSVLGPARVAALRERVDLELAIDNPAAFDAHARVALSVWVKNVPRLVVKVFRIQSLAHFLARGADVDVTIDLDGLSASHEETLTFDGGPLARVQARLELPACDRPGTYVIDLLGGGRASRAVIQKGALRHVARVGAAGLVLEVRDERGEPAPGARVWIGGRELTPRDDGGIVVPFSTEGGRRVPLLLVAGDVAARELVLHPAETYALELFAHAEREAFVAGRRARVLLRPVLTVAGWPAPLALLEETTVEVGVTDLSGTTSSRVMPVALEDDREAVVELDVPDDAAEVVLVLRGRVRQVSTQRDVELSGRVAVSLNGIHRSHGTEGLHLARTSSGWVLYLLGKSGEPGAGRVVNVSVQHRSVTWELNVTLETDARGRIELGALAGITRLTASASGVSRSFALEGPRGPALRLAVREGERVRLPLPERESRALEGRRDQGAALRALFQVVGLRAGAPTDELSHTLTREGETLVLDGLPPGTARLVGRAGEVLAELVVVAAQAPVVSALGGRFAFSSGASSGLTTTELCASPPCLRGLTREGGEVVVRVDGARPGTRAHLVATRFVSDEASGRGLARPGRAPSRERGQPLVARYQSGRELGDEARYVLERRRAPRRPGLMLERPPLLVNPWAVRTTSSSVAVAAEGTAFHAMPARMGAPAPPPPPAPREAMMADGSQASVDFLTRAATVHDELELDARGEARVSLASLAEAVSVRVVLVDDALTSELSLGLDERELTPRDRSLVRALEPSRHVVEDKRLAAARAGDELVQDERTSRWALVDSTAKAHRLLATLSGDDGLRELSFVARWHELSHPERLALYGEHACHELHLFLYFRDRAFFERVVRPHLEGKRTRSLVDDFVLERADLARYLESRAFARLNTLERVLLARRVPTCRAAVVRLLEEAVELSPRDLEREARIVDSLLGAAVLDGEGGGGPPEPMADEAELAFAAAAAPAGFGSFGPPPGGPPGAPSAPAAEAAPQVPQAPKKRARPPGAASGGIGRAAIAQDLADRGRSEAFYRKLDATRELAEAGYRKVRLSDEGPHLVPPSRFWLDLARHEEGPFLSRHLGERIASFTDAMAALAVLDVPFVAGAHEVRRGEGADERVVVRVASDALIALAGLTPASPAVGPVQDPVLVGQSLLRADDRWEWRGSERREKYVQGELSTGVVYASRVVLTNPGGARQRVEVLTQIPERSIPVGGGAATRTHRLELEPYGTTSLEQLFYFPRAGRFSHFPAHVARMGELVAVAEARACEVVSKLAELDPTSWGHVSQHGSLDDVLAFLSRENLGRVDLERIAWRMRDREAYERVTDLLSSRLVFSPTLFAYALRHHDAARAAEWLRHRDDFLDGVGPALEGGLVEVSALERRRYEHLEYAPLVHARAHRLGGKRRILVAAFAEQYRAFLERVVHQRAPSYDDRLEAVHYALAQDRVDEARAMLDELEREPGPLAAPLAYLYAYAAAASGELARARALAEPFVDAEVPRVQTRFRLLVAMLDEAEGRSAGPTAGAGSARAHVPGARDERQDALAAASPTLELVMERDAVSIEHTGLASVELRFYAMDLELLFSRQPFVGADVERFSFIEPGATLVCELERSARRTRVPLARLPDSLAKTNLVVEAVAAGLRKTVAHTAHELSVEVQARYGQLRVADRDTGAPLPATYVKVYGRMRGGDVTFYKDGYTDLRGRFDYASLSTDELERVERFALLVAHDRAGALVLEAEPPAR